MDRPGQKKKGTTMSFFFYLSPKIRQGGPLDLDGQRGGGVGGGGEKLNHRRKREKEKKGILTNLYGRKKASRGVSADGMKKESVRR